MIELFFKSAVDRPNEPVKAMPVLPAAGAGMPGAPGADGIEGEIAMQQANEQQNTMALDMQKQQEQAAKQMQDQQVAAQQAQMTQQAEAQQAQQSAQQEAAAQSITSQQATAANEIEKTKMKAEIDIMKAKMKADKPSTKANPSLWSQRLQRLSKRVGTAAKTANVPPPRPPIAPKNYYGKDVNGGGFGERMTDAADNMHSTYWRDAADGALGVDKPEQAGTIRGLGRSFNRGAANTADFIANSAINAFGKPVTKAIGAGSSLFEHSRDAGSNAASQLRDKGILDTDWGEVYRSGVNKIPGDMGRYAWNSGNAVLGAAYPGWAMGAGALETAFAGDPVAKPQGPSGDPYGAGQQIEDTFGPQPVQTANFQMPIEMQGKNPYLADQWQRSALQYPDMFADYNKYDAGKFKTPWMNGIRNALPGIDNMLTGGKYTSAWRPDHEMFKNTMPGSDSSQLPGVTPGIEQLMQLLGRGGQ